MNTHTLHNRGNLKKFKRIFTTTLLSCFSVQTALKIRTIERFPKQPYLNLLHHKSGGFLRLLYKFPIKLIQNYGRIRKATSKTQKTLLKTENFRQKSKNSYLISPLRYRVYNNFKKIVKNLKIEVVFRVL